LDFYSASSLKQQFVDRRGLDFYSASSFKQQSTDRQIVFKEMMMRSALY